MPSRQPAGRRRYLLAALPIAASMGMTLFFPVRSIDVRGCRVVPHVGFAGVQDEIASGLGATLWGRAPWLVHPAAAPERCRDLLRLQDFVDCDFATSVGGDDFVHRSVAVQGDVDDIGAGIDGDFDGSIFFHHVLVDRDLCALG